MSPALSKMINELSQLSPQEQWTLLGYLTNRLQDTVRLDEASSKLKPTTEMGNALSIFEETRGMWGSSSLTSIDDELSRQRQNDWGE